VAFSGSVFSLLYRFGRQEPGITFWRKLDATLVDIASGLSTTRAVSAASKLLGRGDSGAGAVEEITLGTNITMSGTTLNVSSGSATVGDADYGDITVSGTGAVWTVDNGAISDAKLRDSAAVSVIGRSANSGGDPADIAAGANDRVLARTADSVAFQQLTAGMAPNDVWTYAKIQNVSAASKLLGRGDGGSGDVEEITLGTNIAMSGTTLNVSSGTATVGDADYGDVTVSSSGTVWTIDADAVTYAKIQDVSATDRLLGRSTAGAGVIEEITCTAAGRALLDDAASSNQRTTLGLGTAAVLDVGTGASNIVQLDGTPKLPAVDGSALTNLTVTGTSMVLLQTQSVSGVATIDFVTGTGGTVLTDTYDRYEFKIEITADSDNVEMRMRVGTDVGPTYQADAADYDWHTMYMAGGASAIAADGSDNEMVMSGIVSSGASLGNAAGENYCSEVRFCNPESTTSKKHFYWSGIYSDVAGLSRSFWGGGSYLTAEAITAVRFLTSSGNISGRISLYGFKKA
jgi:hypothetical protein